MTFRARPVTRRKRRTHWENEERTQLWVTLGFLGVVALAFLILGGAVAARYYDEHFKVVARVEGKEINRDQWQLRQKVENFRLDEAESRIRERLSAGTIDSTRANDEISALGDRKGNVAETSLDDLIDQILQGQIASKLSIAVSGPEIDAAFKKDASRPETRKVLAIFVDPEQEAGAEGPTEKQKTAGRQKAEKALAELRAGKSFADVAKAYSSDTSKDKGGDYGYIDAENPIDKPWVEAVYALPVNGTTGVVEGADGVYRIGRVAQIVAAVEDTNYAQKVERTVGAAPYREALTAELLEEKLRDYVSKQALTGDVEQVRAYEIVATIAKDASGQPATGSEARVGHILYSPKKDPQGAAELPATDPAWAEAKKLADATAARLKAIKEAAARQKEFEKVAKSDSDDTGSGATGGDIGFFSRASVAQEFGTAVFEGTHKKGDIIGPTKTQFGYHVIMFQELRPPADKRIEETLQLVKKPGANFQAIAKQRSDAASAAKGGDMGWIARFQLEKDVEDILFRLQAGQISQAQKLDDGYHVYKVEERRKRPVDATQRPAIEANSFKNWYQPQKDAADIYRDPSVSPGAEAP
jgi:parvulin-like peptidyl-prolyl isomerase